MFATYDLTLFPTVIVRFNGNIKTDNDFDSFTQSWLDLYTNKQDYSFIFDTTNMGVPHIKYSFKMTYFIRDLRFDPFPDIKTQDFILFTMKSCQRL